MATQMGGNIPSQNTKVKNKRDEKLRPFELSNRCVETQAQINQVSQVIALTSNALHAYQHSPFRFFQRDDEGEKEVPPLQMTEGQIALEKTLWAACSRMEKILEDDVRWSDEFQRKVEKEYDELHALQMETIERQRAAAAEVTSPHFRYRPDLHRLRDGRWMACLGDVNHLEFAVYGVGDSAQQALEEFDAVFISGVPASVMKWAQQRETDLNNGVAPQPFPNQEQTHEKNDDDNDEKMDGPGNEPRGDSPSAG